MAENEDIASGQALTGSVEAIAASILQWKNLQSDYATRDPREAFSEAGKKLTLTDERQDVPSLGQTEGEPRQATGKWEKRYSEPITASRPIPTGSGSVSAIQTPQGPAREATAEEFDRYSELQIALQRSREIARDTEAQEFIRTRAKGESDRIKQQMRDILSYEGGQSAVTGPAGGDVTGHLNAVIQGLTPEELGEDQETTVMASALSGVEKAARWVRGFPRSTMQGMRSQSHIPSVFRDEGDDEAAIGGAASGGGRIARGRRRPVARRHAIGGAASGGGRIAGTGGASPSSGVLHVWVDGGELQRIGQIGGASTSTGGGTTAGSVSQSGSLATDRPISYYAYSQAASMFSDLSRRGAGAFAGFAADRGGADAVMQDMLSTPGNLIGNTAQGITSGASLGFAIGAIGGPPGAAIGAVVGGVVSAAVEIATLPKKILDWSEALVSSRDHLAKWSGTLQEVAWTRERRTYLREQESATATAPHTRALNDSYQNLLDELRPLRDEIYNDMASLVNFAAIGMTNLVRIDKALNGGLSKGLIPALRWLERIADVADWFMGKESKDTDAMHKRWADNWRRPLKPAAPPP